MENIIGKKFREVDGDLRITIYKKVGAGMFTAYINEDYKGNPKRGHECESDFPEGKRGFYVFTSSMLSTWDILNEDLWEEYGSDCFWEVYQ